MPERWSRRAVLAGIGTAALAGCLSDAGDPTSPAGGTPPSTSAGTDPGSGPATRDGTTEDGGAGSPTDDTATGSPAPDPAPPAAIDTGWPAPAADAGRSNHAAGAAGPTERVADLWRLIADTSFSTPVVADGTVFVGGGDGSVRALDARSGETRWQRSVGAAAGTPWAVGDDLVVPTSDALVALARTDGSESWRAETPGRAAVLVADHGVYWFDADGPSVVALGRTDGDERWRTPIDDPWEATLFASDRTVFVSSGTHDSRFWTLAVDGGDCRGKAPRSGADFPAEQFYADGTVYAVDAFFGNVDTTAVGPDGVDWSQGVPPGGGAGGGLLSGGGDRVYYTSTVDDEPGLTALSATDGTVAWTADADATITGRPVAAGEAVLVPTDDGVRAYDTADGSGLWTRADVGRRFVVVDDLVYAAGEGTVRALRAP